MTSRDRYLLRKYGITESEYDVLLAWNYGAGWICDSLPKKRRLHVEHDHRTDAVRGLTCWSCNVLLKQAKDDPAILMSAANYLVSDNAQNLLSLERTKDA